MLTAAVCFVGMEKAVGSSDLRDARPARGAQCIRQRATVPAVGAQDVSCSRYDVAADITTIFQEELCTDATVAAQGRVWHVHRAILASASPILKNAFLCGTPLIATSNNLSYDLLNFISISSLSLFLPILCVCPLRAHPLVCMAYPP